MRDLDSYLGGLWQHCYPPELCGGRCRWWRRQNFAYNYETTTDEAGTVAPACDLQPSTQADASSQAAQEDVLLASDCDDAEDSGDADSDSEAHDSQPLGGPSGPEDEAALASFHQMIETCKAQIAEDRRERISERQSRFGLGES